MTPQRWAIVDTEGLVHNVVLWDGETPWEPDGDWVAWPLDDELPVNIGDRIDPDGYWTAKRRRRG